MRRLMQRFQPSIEARITDALGKLLAAIEASEVTIMAAASALRWHGENLHKAGGVEAMRSALDTVCTANPDWADERRATITAAWAALSEMKP
ncbi:hypothetical protein FV227_14925 [Methylobacterium sp. WL119]|uniref:hypothetical protein n=1 Tax=Methylobacterium sp. WL93 TaxID=2603892 RepID=UPI0011C8AA20|nr:hypothetical protein [Methylobacterium sp. WL93]TXN41403.1 hypothetical protein FV225_02635 [Methylobacterium sp. WL93]TXN49785.1 hypothetical protein FV227_14925 [Methylobacterium sp. WL119]